MYMPDFKSEPERQQWLTSNADYFTVVSAATGPSVRVRAASLLEAEAIATAAVTHYPDLRLMIYAVRAPYDTYVKTVQAPKGASKPADAV